jgi:hypothetical protein
VAATFGVDLEGHGGHPGSERAVVRSHPALTPYIWSVHQTRRRPGSHVVTKQIRSIGAATGACPNDRGRADTPVSCSKPPPEELRGLDNVRGKGEPRDHGVKHETDVRPRERTFLTSASVRREVRLERARPGHLRTTAICHVIAARGLGRDHISRWCAAGSMGRRSLWRAARAWHDATNVSGPFVT